MFNVLSDSFRNQSNKEKNEIFFSGRASEVTPASSSDLCRSTTPLHERLFFSDWSEH